MRSARWRAAHLLRERGAGPERVALQLLHTPPARDPDVVTKLRHAAASAHARGAPATAAVLLDRAMAEPPGAELRGELLVALGRAELAAGKTVDGSERLFSAYRCATDAL